MFQNNMNMNATRLLLTFFFFTISQLTFAQNPFDVAIEHIKRTSDYEPVDLVDIILTDQYQTRHNGMTHVYLRQRFEGIEIEGANVNFNIPETGRVSSFGGSFVKNLSQKITTTTPQITQEQALQQALTHYGIMATPPFSVLENPGGKEQKLVFDKGDFALENIPVRLVYVQGEDETLQLAWELHIYETSAHNAWVVYLDAATGAVLKDYNLVVHCQFDEGYHFSKTQTISTTESIISIKQNAMVVDESYRVFAMPVESPSHGGRTLEISPWEQAGDAGTLGWHNDGDFISEYTRGNNVDAYEDNNNSNDPSGGDAARAHGGSNHEFDFPLDLEANPLTQQDPIITNLFYWNNIIHDVMYQYGFDEPSGNFQADNLGRGGAGGDYVRAEAQDNINGPGNNANFYTQSDGIRPRMQMYLWDAVGGDSLEVNAPGNVAGDYIMVLAAFGGNLNNPLTGNVVEVDDGSGNPTLGCNALVNGGEISGNIALVDRGSCEFGTKCLRAQNAGAIAVIVCNNVSGNPIAMAPGGQGGQVNIPAVMIRQDDCATIRTQLNNGLNVTMVDSPSPPKLDSDLDNGVIVHEYGHGISNRLTGGPNNVGCLSNAEQMGEGWSDFFAIWMTTQSSDQHYQPRGMGTYLVGQPTNGKGIRPTAYSTSFAINASSYGNIHNSSLISQPHGIGYLWCTMLWDLNWAMINAHGFDSNFYNSGSSAGNILTLQLVMDGLKGQPCSPGFEDGRDAILAADQANNGGENTDIIWNVFARRGMGYSASQGSSNNRFDGNQAFDLPPGVPQMTEEELFGFMPLPVELVAFNAVPNETEKRIELFWNTASETNNKGFEVLRRTEANPAYEIIGWVAGAGDSFDRLYYQFYDKNVDAGTRYYYQLKQVDFDGKFSKSPLVTAMLSGLEAEIEVFPNPTADIAVIRLSSIFSGKNLVLKVIDAKGQLIDQQPFVAADNAELEVNFSHLAEGVYFIQVDMDGKTVTKPVFFKR